MNRRRTMRYRRARWLVGYWQGDTLLWQNFAGGEPVGGDPLAGVLLDYFDAWRRVEELVAAFPEYTAKSLRAAVKALAETGLLEREGAASRVSKTASKDWKAWNPAAGFFHFTTKDVKFDMDLGRVIRGLKREAKKDPPPAMVKRYPGAVQVALPKPEVHGEFVQVLKARRTWRQFGGRKLTIGELATLLHLTFGVQRWVDVAVYGKLPLKTSASGGALHPVEAYVYARRVEGVAPGWYHYSSDRHRLERVRRGASSAQVEKYLKGQWWFRNAPVLVAMTAVWARSQWKYRFPRAYRVVLADAGHVCQTFCLTATWLGLAPFSTMALADTMLERDLGIDGVTESVLYVAGVGARPEGVEWTPFPRKVRQGLQG